jgi:tetratricopeptide (TPR) repeat protein
VQVVYRLLKSIQSKVRERKRRSQKPYSHSLLILKNNDAIVLGAALDRDPENAELAVRVMKAALGLSTDDKVAVAIEVGERFLAKDMKKRFFAKDPKKKFGKLMVDLYRRLPSVVDVEDGLDRVYSHFQDDGGLLVQLAAGYLGNSNLDKAEAALRRALDIAPNNLDTVYRLAGVLAQQSKVSEAIALLHQGIPIERQDAAFHARVGHLKVWSGDIEGAIPFLQNALSLDQYHSGALGDLSLAYDLKGDIVLAAELLTNSMVAAAIKRPSSVPGLQEISPNMANKRLMRMHHMNGNHTIAKSIHAEIRRKTKMVLPYETHEWSSEEFDGSKVMAIAQSGLGDEIRFTSVYNAHFAKAASVTMTCDPRLLSILSRSFPNYTVYPVQRVHPRIKKDRADERRRLLHQSMRSLVTDEVVDAGETADIWVRTIDLFEATSFGSSDAAVTRTLNPCADLRRKYR